MNDSYLKVWNSIPPDCPHHFLAFLSKIVRMKAIDYYRYNQRGKRSTEEYDISLEELENCLPSKSNVEGDMNAGLLRDQLNEFLGTLNEEQRNLFLCRYFFFDSLKDSAKYCGISEAAAKSSLFRIRNNLRTFLEKEGFEI